MATAQVESATTALHDEKLEDQPIKTTEENTDHQETKITAPVDAIVAPELEGAAPEPEPELKPEPEPELEPDVLAGEVETKVVVKEEEVEGNKAVIPVDDQPAKVAPEPCVEELEAKEPEGEPVETGTITEPAVEAEPEDQEAQKKEEGTAGAADDQ